MTSQTKLGLITLSVLLILITFATLINRDQFVLGDNTTKEKKPPQSIALEKIVKDNLEGVKGDFAVYIEDLEATPSEKYYFNEQMSFPTASLYKLILLAAVLDDIEKGQINLDDQLISSKTHLTSVFGAVDFGYSDVGEKITYPVKIALERVGRISDNFAAIMLTEKVRENGSGKEDPLVKTAKELGLKNTVFQEGTATTTAEDMGIFFKKLYRREIISATVSGQVEDLLLLSKLNDRIPAKLPEDVKIVHKTGELAHLRHDGGVVYLPGHPYVIVMMSQNLQYEDEGVATFVQTSKDIYDYFKGK